MSRFVIALLVLFLPSTVSAAAIDEYYLARFGESGTVAKALTEVAPGVARADRCITPLYRSLTHDWNTLQPSTQKTLAKYLSRPTLSGETVYPSPGGHFAIHYALSGTDAPSLTDADYNGFPDWVEKVAAVFEYVYSVEVAGMGYRPPPVTRYDVYLKDLTYRSAYGFTNTDGAPTYPATSSASYITIDRSFSDPMFTENGLYTPEQCLDVTAAHEFHHAIQYGYNYYFDIWYAEMTSTWMEDEVYDSVNQLYSYLDDYLPVASTVSLNAPPGRNSQYGRWIFNRYLVETHSSALIKDIWTRLGTMSAPANVNTDIPMLPVIDAALGANGSSVNVDFLGFAKTVYLRNWGTHTGEIGMIPVVAPQGSYSSYPVDLTALNNEIVTLPEYTFACYRFLRSSTAPANLVLPLSVPAGVGVVALKRETDGSVQEYPFDRSTGTVTVPSFNSVATSEVDLLIVNDTATASQATAVASGSGKGGGCFIATAAYGSYLHPKVALLRQFRDRHLLTNAPGRLFVSLYYRFSPPIADLIAQHEWMRALVRGMLVPVILAVQYPVVALALASVSLAAMGAWWLRRQARIQTA